MSPFAPAPPWKNTEEITIPAAPKRILNQQSFAAERILEQLPFDTLPQQSPFGYLTCPVVYRLVTCPVAFDTWPSLLRISLWLNRLRIEWWREQCGLEWWAGRLTIAGDSRASFDWRKWLIFRYLGKERKIKRRWELVAGLDTLSFPRRKFWFFWF